MGVQSELTSYYIREALQEYLSDPEGKILLEKTRFLDELHAKEIISALDLAQIRTLENTGSRVSALIDIMSRMSLKRNIDFLQCLKEAGRKCDVNNTPQKDRHGKRGGLWTCVTFMVIMVAILLYHFLKPDSRLTIAEKFREEYSRIPQWSSPHTWSMLQENAYTPMTWVMIDRTNTRVTENILDDYHQLLTKVDERPLYVIIIGESGIGKTTFMRHFAYIWASSVINPGFLDKKTQALMKQFDIIFPLKLIDLKPKDDLYSFIRRQFSFLEHDSNLQTMLTAALSNPRRTLCFFDGYNEMTDDPPREFLNIIERKNTSLCSNIIITSTEYKANDLRRNLGFTGREATLKGFNTDQIKAFVNKCYVGNIKGALDFTEYLQTDKEQIALAQNPLQLQMLCAHSSNGKTKKLIERRVTRYMESLVIIFLRYHVEKMNGSRLSMDEILDTYKEQIKALGRLGWYGCSREVETCPMEFMTDTVKKIAGDEALTYGILEQTPPDFTTQSAWVSFIFPKYFFREFLIALSHHLGNKELMPDILDYELFEQITLRHARSEKELSTFIHEAGVCKTNQHGECDYKNYNKVKVYYLKLTAYRRFSDVWNTTFKPGPRMSIADKIMEEYSRIPQWTSSDAWSLSQENAYTPMTWEMIDRTSTKVTGKILDGYHQLLTKVDENPLYVIITGESGIGKTTFIRHFAYTWASSIINPDSLDKQNRTLMKQFDYIFPLKLIDLDQTDDIYSFIRRQFSLLDDGGNLQKILTAASSRPHKTLCLFDGYTEMTDDPPREILDIIERKNTSLCFNIIITSREYKANDLRRHLGQTGKEAVLKGFNTEQIKIFVNKCYLGNAKGAQNFIRYLQIEVEQLALAQNPLQLQMLCPFSGKDNTERLIERPVTRYMESLVIILRRYHVEKRRGSYLSIDGLLDIYKESIKALGRLGWHGCNWEIKKCPMNFSLDIVNLITGKESLKIGILAYIRPYLTTESVKVSFINPESYFQEFIIALSHHLGNNALMPHIFRKSLFEYIKADHTRSDNGLSQFIHESNVCLAQGTVCDFKSYNMIQIYYMKITQYERFITVWKEFGYDEKALISP